MKLAEQLANKLSVELDLSGVEDQVPMVARLLMSIFCGAAIGIEREWARKGAGLRTMILICMGATLYMAVGGLHGDIQRTKDKGTKPVEVPEYWKSDMIPETMRHGSGHGGSAVFISAEFINALVEDREPEIDVYEALAMTVPGIVAHQSAFKEGEQLPVPQFDRPKKT